MSGAERSRRYRARRSAGLVRLEVTLPSLDLAEALHRAGYLASPDTDDPHALQAALQSFLELVTRDACDFSAAL